MNNRTREIVYDLPFGISESVWSQIQSVFRKYPSIEKVILYGSRAKGTQKEASDIDITLIGANITTQTLAEITYDIEELNLPWMIDISIFHHIQVPSLIAHIQRVGQVIYTSDNLTSTF